MDSLLGEGVDPNHMPGHWTVYLYCLGASDYVDSLLGEGVDPNHMPGQSINPPVVIAAERNHQRSNM